MEKQTVQRLKLPISDIAVDWSVQPRNGAPDPEIVEQYAADVEDGQSLPPVTVFACIDRENQIILVDGRHRLEAHIAAKCDEIEAEVHEGTHEQAVEYAAGCNSKHGQRRSPEDIYRAIENLFALPKYEKVSDREIAVLVRCSHPTVSKVRKDLIKIGRIKGSDSRIGKDGVERTNRKPNRKPIFKQDGKVVATPPKDVENLVSGLDLADGAVVEIRTNGTIKEEAGETGNGFQSTPTKEDPPEPPFDPLATDLGQLLPSIKDAKGKVSHGPSLKKYIADSKAYMDPTIHAWLAETEKVRERLEVWSTQARKTCGKDNLPPFLLRLRMLLTTKPIEDWSVCQACQGAGSLPGKGDCHTCRGHGYRI